MKIEQLKQIKEVKDFTNKLIKICEDRLKILSKETSLMPEVNRRIELRKELISGFNEISKKRIKEIIKEGNDKKGN
jgi:hypothetical protein